MNLDCPRPRYRGTTLPVVGSPWNLPPVDPPPVDPDDPEPPPADTTRPAVFQVLANGAQVAIDFDENLDASSLPATSAFTVDYATGTDPAVTAVGIVNQRVALTVSPAVPNGVALTVSYAAPVSPAAGVLDLAGNRALSFGPLNAVNQTPPAGDTTPPVAISASTNGSILVVGFNEPLDPDFPAVGAWFINRSGGQVQPVDVDMSGAAVYLTLPKPAQPGEAMNVNYLRPSDPALRLRDLAGNAALTISGLGVVNNTEPEPEPPDPPPTTCFPGSQHPQGTWTSWNMVTGDHPSLFCGMIPELIPVRPCGTLGVGYFMALQFQPFAAGSPGGYLGLQVDTNSPMRYSDADAALGHIPPGYDVGDPIPGWPPEGEYTLRAIFSWWDKVHGTLTSGDTMPVPSGELGALARRWTDPGEGGSASGCQTGIPFPWTPGTHYRLRVRESSVAGGTRRWEGTATPAVGGVFHPEDEKLIGFIDVPAAWGGMHWHTTQFLEYYGPHLNDCTNLARMAVQFTGPNMLDADDNLIGRNGNAQNTTGSVGCGSACYAINPTVMRHVQGFAT